MRIVVQVALFIAVVLFGDRLVASVAGRVVRHSRNEFVKMYEGKSSADTLLLGNSRVDRNISVDRIHEMTGRRCLNLGLGGNHMLISEALLKDFVERYGNPKLAIIELSQSTVSPENMGEMSIFCYFSTNIQALARNVDPTYSTFASVFNSLRFNSPGFWRLSMESFSRPQSRLLSNTIPPEIINQWNEGKQVELPIIAKNVSALRSMCAYADLKNIEIRLVIGPYWGRYKRAISNYSMWKSALEQAALGHRVYDYSEVFFEHGEYFNDEMHLNATGANRFVERLVEDGVL